MNRQEHLKWCKQRALEYVDRNELTQAYTSFISDLGKHDETCDHPAIKMGVGLMMVGNLNTPDEMRKFINNSG
ncbi:hypothetical protein LCGC14_1731050 [marine sediment metagenome]|uniref:Uncharacterized protein n=1 Tax=marine sediment metagenome TaxID=412755 RepID=A0A0F9K989_9ZZZZ